MTESAHEMRKAMKRLLDTGEGADWTLVCRGKTWKVHSNYLWPRSSWFKAACKGGFKKGETQRIDFPEEEPSMVYRMLQHFYLQTYTVNLGLDPFWSLNDSWAKTRLHVHAQMYSLGDKYDLPGLKKEAARRFGEDVGIPGDRKCETLTLLSVVEKIYTTTPALDSGLRNLVVRQIFQRYNTASKHFVEELDTALEVRKFARDIIVMHRTRPTIQYTALLREMYHIWQHYVRLLLVVATSSFRTTANVLARLSPTRLPLGWFLCFEIAALMLLAVINGHLEMLVGQRPASGNCWARPPSVEKVWRAFRP